MKHKIELETLRQPTGKELLKATDNLKGWNNEDYDFLIDTLQDNINRIIATNDVFFMVGSIWEDEEEEPSPRYYACCKDEYGIVQFNVYSNDLVTLNFYLSKNDFTPLFIIDTKEEK